jgi:hypothetical protein
MRTFNINEFKKHPGRKLILRHYRKEQPEIWAIEEAQATIGEQLVIKVPTTGYDTEDYKLVSYDCEVREKDGNMVGTVEFATEEITLDAFADRLLNLPLEETLEFTCGIDEECEFVATKIKVADSILLVVAAKGEINSFTHNISTGKLTEELGNFLQDDIADYLYIDLCPKIEKELWGVTFNYEEIGGEITRKLAVTDCYDFFNSKAEAEKWIADHHDGSYDSDLEKEYCSAPKAVLIDKWKE